MAGYSLSDNFYEPDTRLTWHQAVSMADSADYIVFGFPDCCYVVVPKASFPQVETALSMWKQLDTPLVFVNTKVWSRFYVKPIPVAEMDSGEENIQQLLGKEQYALLISDERPVAVVAAVETQRGKPPDHDREIPRMAENTGTGTSAASTGAKQPPSRFINTWLEDYLDKPHDPRQKPLLVGQVYSLFFDVGFTSRPESIIAGADESIYRGPNEEAVITVRIESSDFKLLGEKEGKLIVPAGSASTNKLYFSIVPKHDGLCVLNALFLKDGNFIQLITLKFNEISEELYAGENLGRDINAAAFLKPRDACLIIKKAKEGYDMWLASAAGALASAKLCITPEEVRDIAREARHSLLDLVNLNVGNVLVYQASTTIDEKIHQTMLRKLAEAGCTLYQRLFFGSGADEKVNFLGRKLAELALGDRYSLQIFSQDFLLPWGLLYLAEKLKLADSVNPALFLGLNNVIEHMLLQQPEQEPLPELDVESGLSVSLNLNMEVEQRFNFPHDQYWKPLVTSNPQIKLAKFTTAQQVADALDDPAKAGQVIYFYCHGVSQDENEAGGVDETALIFQPGGRLTLKDLRLNAPVTDKLSTAPLVFINACESAELSPLVYDGFVPYFIARGARGVIGTECTVPSRFALEWAKRFFDHFLKGEPLGEIFLTLRQEFVAKEHNLLGLLYSLYVDFDTKLDRPVVSNQ